MFIQTLPKRGFGGLENLKALHGIIPDPCTDPPCPPDACQGSKCPTPTPSGSTSHVQSHRACGYMFGFTVPPNLCPNSPCSPETCSNPPFP